MSRDRIWAEARDEIIRQIRERAKSYVPEWRFDEEFPDIGTALALVYGDMFSRTVNRFDQIFLKNRIAFLNELNAELLPARGAEGYVSFGLVNDEVQGVELPAGTVVNCREGDEEGDLHYRTRDDVYVSPARVGYLFFASDREDYISCLYQGGEMEEIPLFDLTGENLQKHELYFGHKQALYIKRGGWIRLGFFQRGGLQVSQEFLEVLADSSCVRFEYYSEEGWQPFEKLSLVQGGILLRKGDHQPAFGLMEQADAGGYYIRCRALRMEKLRKLSLSGLKLRTWSEDIAPDCVYANGIESSMKSCFPFGERITPFNEAYFGCEEALCKKGAKVVLSFVLDFARIPLDYNMENDPVKWEWVMKRSDFRADPEYDVTVDEVIWEYYNGTGWARLFPDDRYSRIFFPDSLIRGSCQKVEFICPKDMEPLTVNSCRTWYIRARVLKVNNLFKLKGNYVPPVMENTSFSYDYEGCEVEPEAAYTLNCLEQKPLCFPDEPFKGTGASEGALYLGFERPLLGGPLKLLFQMKDTIEGGETGILWEYFDGSRWRELSLVDETRGFSRTGLVTMMGRPDMRPGDFFGQNCCWLRVRDIGEFFRRENGKERRPRLQGIHMNTTRIAAVDRVETEYFRMEYFQENTSFRLMVPRIIQAEVYVNEAENISGEALEYLMDQGRVRPVYDQSGILREAWVRWERKADFSESGEESRDYVLDQNEGVIWFGNGRRGRIPPSSREDNICVEYSSGGGERTNLGAGAVDQLAQETGFINQVKNPLPLFGGCNVETLDKAIRRNCAALRHQNRAVTARDYEELIEASSRSVRSAHCFSGWNKKGERCPGAVTIVVLKRDMREPFDEICREARGFLRGKVEDSLLESGRLALIEPEFVELSVRAEVTVRDYNLAFQVKRQVLERLEQFLDPIKGNFKGQGWEIGWLPNSIQIKNAIGGTPGMAFVRGIYISAFAGGAEGYREVDLEHMSRRKYVLPVSGTHEVLVGIE